MGTISKWDFAEIKQVMEREAEERQKRVAAAPPDIREEYGRQATAIVTYHKEILRRLESCVRPW